MTTGQKLRDQIRTDLEVKTRVSCRLGVTLEGLEVIYHSTRSLFLCLSQVLRILLKDRMCQT